MPTFPDLDAAVRWLESQINYERSLGRISYDSRTFDIQNFSRRLDQLGAPQRGLRTIHIAGTRGKGSSALALESLLRAAGLRTATFTSPHLRSYAERIRIDGQPLAPARFAQLLGPIADLASHAPGPADHGFKTVFENLTALFFLAAREEAVDWAIVETGLGGRLDATNALDPGPVLLTRIGLEHTHLLGDTIDAIATEKAAILKPGGWGVFTTQEPSGAAETVFRRRAAETGAQLDSAAQFVPLRACRADSKGLQLDFEFAGAPLPLRTALLGPFQAENLQGALAMVAALHARGLLPSPPPALLPALQSLQVPGRMQRLSGRLPEWIVDGAHCPTGAGALAAALEAHFGDQPALALVAMVEEKDHDGFFAALARWPGWRAVICTTAPTPRALPAPALAAAARRYFPDVRVYPQLDVALQQTTRLAEETHIRAVACGSMYTIAPVQAWVGGQ